MDMRRSLDSNDVDVGMDVDVDGNMDPLSGTSAMEVIDIETHSHPPQTTMINFGETEPMIQPPPFCLWQDTEPTTAAEYTPELDVGGTDGSGMQLMMRFGDVDTRIPWVWWREMERRPYVPRFRAPCFGRGGVWFGYGGEDLVEGGEGDEMGGVEEVEGGRSDEEGCGMEIRVENVSDGEYSDWKAVVVDAGTGGEEGREGVAEERNGSCELVGGSLP